MNRETIALAGIGTFLALFLARFRGKREGNMEVRPANEPEYVQELAEGTSTEPIAYGTKEEVRGLLDEYARYLKAQGVNMSWFSVGELTKLRRTGKYAIPPKHLWDEMARTILFVAQPIREEFGHPLNIYNAYRPRWYNEQVGGAKNSLHIRNAALDLIPYDGSLRRRLAEVAARYFIDNGDRYQIGMGIYNYPRMTGVHVDGLVRKRAVPYAATRKWIDAVGAVA